MTRLSRAELEALLAFGAELSAAASNPDRVDDWALEAIAGLLHADLVGYTEIGPSHQIVHDAEFPGPPVSPGEEVIELLETQGPFVHFSARTHDPYFEAYRLSDVVDMRAFRHTELFEIISADMPHEVQTWMPGQPGATWVLGAARGSRDFSARDLVVLNWVRAALMPYEAQRRLLDELSALRSTPPGELDTSLLSRRENEVLDLVAGGASNAQIAERLWISPSTVKKHLDNIYAKLDVGSRTAALAQSGRSLAGTKSGSPAATSPPTAARVRPRDPAPDR